MYDIVASTTYRVIIKSLPSFGPDPSSGYASDPPSCLDRATPELLGDLEQLELWLAVAAVDRPQGTPNETLVAPPAVSGPGES